TSISGLVAAMLTTPDENNCPLYGAEDIIPFYLEHYPIIFSQSSMVEELVEPMPKI
ncbi:hypothetical protein GBA52_010302, partial [Prunus armeniaca]